MGWGNLKSKVLHYLRLRNVPWVPEVEISTDLHATHGSISRVVYELSASGLIEIVRTDSCRTLVSLIDGPSGELPAITKQERILKILKDATEWVPSEQFPAVGNKNAPSLKSCI